MEKLLHNFTPHAKIYWYQDDKAIRCEWLELFGELEELKRISNQAVEEIKTQRANKIIVDSYNSSGVSPEGYYEHISKNLTPMAVKNGAKTIIIIKPKSQGLSSIATNKWEREINESGLVKMTFSNLEDCMQWLSENK